MGMFVDKLSGQIFSFNFSGSSGSGGTTIHNNLSGIQGGSPNQYYHLSNTEYNDTLQTIDGFDIFTGSTAPSTYQTKSSISTYTGTTLPNIFLSKSSFNTYSGLTATQINNRLLISSFNTYSGLTLTQINNKLTSSSFNTYSGLTATQINGKLSNSSFNTYSGLTAIQINNRLVISSFNIYSGLTLSQINGKLTSSSFNTYSGLTSTQINNRLLISLFNTYSGLTLTQINGKLSNSSFNTYSGLTITQINDRLLVSSFNTYSGLTLTQINDKLSNSSFNMYSGTTVPNNYQTKSSISTYTGTTAPSIYNTKSNFNIYSGITETNVDLLNNVLNGGHLSGGSISLIGSINFSIAPGIGLARNNFGDIIKITWGLLTGSTINGGSNFININYMGNIVVTSTYGSPDNIRLGFVTSDASNSIIFGLSSIKSTLTNSNYNLIDFFISTIGSLIEDGCSISFQPFPNQLSIIRSNGNAWSQFNRMNLPEASGFTKVIGSNNGGGIDFTNPNQINVTHWNDLTQPTINALVPMTSGYWKKDLIITGIEGGMYYLYGTEEYPDEESAKSAPITFIEDDSEVIRLMSFVIQEGSTGITTTYDLRPIFAKLFGAVPSTPLNVIDHGDLAGLADDDHLQYLTDVRADIRYQLQINNKLNISTFNTYSGITAPSLYKSKIEFNAYTATTNNRFSTIETNYISGVTNLGGISLYTSIIDNKIQSKGIVAGNNITLLSTTTGITISSDGSSMFSVININIAITPKSSGSFLITGLTSLISGNSIFIQQTNGPYIGKGSLDDESEMDGIIISGKIINSTTIKCFWKSLHKVKGSYKFVYQT